MTANYLDVNKTFAKVIDDLNLGISVFQENDDANPPESGRWAEMNMLSHDTDPLAKDDGHDNTGVCQISLFDADTGTLQSAILTLADTIQAAFTHGQEYTEFNSVTVFIDRVRRNRGRMVGKYYQVDLSIFWRSYA